ncbi:MAG: hypothetical protein ACXABI_05595 [Candidatus Hodarchaeales archaeon]|jgi:hypothetical protein
MIIKNLWIISRFGLCYYNYKAPHSDYQIDKDLFSGFVAGLSTFAESLSSDHKSVEYLKLGGDELYFERIDELIVASILTGGSGNLQPFSIKIMLQFIGTKFYEKYQEKIEDLLYDWNQGVNGFTKEIIKFLNDKELIEDIKREQFQKLFTEAISGNSPIESLYWKGIQLFSDLSPKILKNSIKKISSLEDVVSTVVYDEYIEGKIHDVLYRLLRDLQSNIFKHKQKKIIILSRSDEIFLKLKKILLSKEILPLHCLDFQDLQGVIETWKDPEDYDILIISGSITSKEIRILHNLKVNGETKIIAVVNRIPKPPRGRLTQKKPISFVIQENIDDFNRNSPFVEYLLTCLVQES